MLKKRRADGLFKGMHICQKTGGNLPFSQEEAQGKMTNGKSYGTIRAKIRKGCVVHLEKNTAFELIKARVAGVLKEQNFQLKSDEIVDEQDGSRYALFTTEKRAVGIVWDAKKKRYVLQISTVTDGEVDESWRTLALWLFDPENQNDQDAKSIANDFEDSLVQLNPKNAPAKREPTTNKKSKITMDGFVQNFVKLYPQYQDELNAHVEHYGQLLPDTFIDEVVAEYMMSMLTQRKNAFIKKLFEFLNNHYNNGDDNVRSAIMVTLFRHLLDNEEAERLAQETYMSETLKRSWLQMGRMLRKKGDKLPW